MRELANADYVQHNPFIFAIILRNTIYLQAEPAGITLAIR